MPEIRRDPETGAKLYKKTRKEKEIDSLNKRVTALEDIIIAMSETISELLEEFRSRENDLR